MDTLRDSDVLVLSWCGETVVACCVMSFILLHCYGFKEYCFLCGVLRRYMVGLFWDAASGIVFFVWVGDVPGCALFVFTKFALWRVRWRIPILIYTHLSFILICTHLC